VLLFVLVLYISHTFSISEQKLVLFCFFCSLWLVSLQVTDFGLSQAKAAAFVASYDISAPRITVGSPPLDRSSNSTAAGSPSGIASNNTVSGSPSGQVTSPHLLGSIQRTMVKVCLSRGLVIIFFFFFFRRTAGVLLLPCLAKVLLRVGSDMSSARRWILTRRIKRCAWNVSICVTFPWRLEPRHMSPRKSGDAKRENKTFFFAGLNNKSFGSVIRNVLTRIVLQL
jgi:hypothetical protein